VHKQNERRIVLDHDEPKANIKTGTGRKRPMPGGGKPRVRFRQATVEQGATTNSSCAIF